MCKDCKIHLARRHTRRHIGLDVEKLQPYIERFSTAAVDLSATTIAHIQTSGYSPKIVRSIVGTEKSAHRNYMPRWPHSGLGAVK